SVEWLRSRRIRAGPRCSMPDAPPSTSPQLLRSRVMAQSSKFNLPRATASFVRRKAIDERIARGAPAKLVLVRAPAGFGKTTALRQIHDQLAESGIATAWITLDAADNDVPRFLSCLAEAVARLQIDDDAHAGTDSDAVAALGKEG